MSNITLKHQGTGSSETASVRGGAFGGLQMGGGMTCEHNVAREDLEVVLKKGRSGTAGMEMEWT